jgi:hypothetical protein
MIAWTAITLADLNDDSNVEKQTYPAAAAFLYRLTVASPGWAGGILAIYSIFLCRYGTLKFRAK